MNNNERSFIKTFSFNKKNNLNILFTLKFLNQTKNKPLKFCLFFYFHLHSSYNCLANLKSSVWHRIKRPIILFHAYLKKLLISQLNFDQVVFKNIYIRAFL